jgi:serine/threonine protein kinase
VQNPRPDPGNDPPRPGDRKPIEEPAQKQDELFEVARRILDGEPVDWGVFQSSCDGASAPVLDQLRILAGLAESHRSVQASGPRGAPEDELQAWGDLEIIEPIGAGSFGTVYHAWDPKLDREIALKVLRPSQKDSVAPGDSPATIVSPPLSSPRTRERTIGEARLLAKVRHANVVTVYGADERDGLIGICMELVEGETLRSLVRRQGSLGAGEATAIGHDVLDALAAVHRAGILHRDIKAQNVMRAKGGRIVLMDFGLGKDVRTRGGGGVWDWALGAALYAAPERLRGGDATVQSDLYGVGVLLYYLVTARYPYEGENLSRLLDAHERNERIYLRDRRPDLPRAFIEVVERALRPEPRGRYSSAGEMDAALGAAGSMRIPLLARAKDRLRRIRIRMPAWRRAAWLLAVPLVAAAAIGIARHDRYSVEAALCRSLPDGGEATLTVRDGIARDDRISLRFRANRDLYLYVVERSPSGSMTLLFPNPPARRNPLTRDTPHRLSDILAPEMIGAGRTGVRGRIEYLFVASKSPLASLAARVGSAPVPADEAATTRIFREARILNPKRESVRGVWIRRLELSTAGQ